jgi:hypothetical protein
MRGSIGALALRLAAIAILFAPAAVAQDKVKFGTFVAWWGICRVCGDVYYPPPSPAPEPPVRHATESTVRYKANDEELKAQLQAIERGGTFERGTPPGSSLRPTG